MSTNRYTGERELPLFFDADAQLEKNRFVQFDTANIKASYAEHGDIAKGITRMRGQDNNYYVTVEPLDFIRTTFFVEMASAVTKGDAVFSSEDGKGAAKSHDVVSLNVTSEPSPSEDCYYVVPSSGWSGEHANALASYDNSEGSFTYTPVAEAEGLVVYSEEDGLYYICNGTTWVRAKQAAIAGDSGVAGSTVACYLDSKKTPVTKEDMASDIVPGGRIVVADSTPLGNDTEGELEVKDARIEAGDLVFASINSTTNATFVSKAVATDNTVTITLDQSGGEDTSVSYMVVRPC